MLKGALETLLEPSARRDYDERLLVGDVVEEVPADFVAGGAASGSMHGVAWSSIIGHCWSWRVMFNEALRRPGRTPPTVDAFVHRLVG